MSVRYTNKKTDKTRDIDVMQATIPELTTALNKEHFMSKASEAICIDRLAYLKTLELSNG